MLSRVIEAYREAYRGVPIAVWMNSLVLLVARCGTMVLPFLSLYCTKELEMELDTAGWLLAIYGAGGVIGGLLGGWLTQTIGSIRTQIFSLVASIPAFLVAGQLRHFQDLACALFAIALVGDMIRPAAASTTVEYCEHPGQRTKALAVNRLAVNLGMTIGPAVGGFLALVDFRLLFYGNAMGYAGALFFLIAYFGWGKRPPVAESTVSSADSQSVRAGLKSPMLDFTFVLFWCLTAMASIVFFQIMSTYPLFLEEYYTFNEAHIGLLLAINTVVVVLFELVLIQYVQRFSILHTIAWGNILVCLGFGLLPLAVGSSFYLGAIYCAFTVVIWSIGEMLAMPLSMAFVADRATDANRGKYMGWYVTAWSLASVVAPIIGMSLYRWSPSGLWYLIAGLSVAIGYGFYWLAAHVRRESLETSR